MRKGIYSFPGPSYAPFDGPPPVPFAAPRQVRVMDGKRVRAVFRLVPVYDDAEGILVDEKAGIRVRLDQIEPGNAAGAGDRVARRDRPTVVIYDAEERAARRLPMLWVIYDEVRGIYRFDMRPLNEKGHRARAGHRFYARADRLARVLWTLNEDAVTVDLVRAGLERLPR
ncbi:hypothetical protein [Corynebacterium falsenii]|uniref:hypothetical protein n=1 Tax=Corynebacterium falsenii TaxID=108486 RepID=UPI0011C23FF5|nr:hypothetical protein [Corynebacterium falsenii]